MYLQPEKSVCCEKKQNNCFQNIKRACFHKIRKYCSWQSNIQVIRQYLTIWERAYYSITCFFSTFNEISRWVMISYSNNVVAFSFIWFYRSQMCLITCAWFWSDWFFLLHFLSIKNFNVVYFCGSCIVFKPQTMISKISCFRKPGRSLNSWIWWKVHWCWGRWYSRTSRGGKAVLD